MNFFNFDAKSHRITIAQDFWIYILLLVPLTLCTFAVWIVLARRTKASRTMKDLEEEYEMMSFNVPVK